MRLRNLFMILLLCMTVGIFSACTGDDGATGPQGDPGEQGEQGEKGDPGDAGNLEATYDFLTSWGAKDTDGKVTCDNDIFTGMAAFPGPEELNAISTAAKGAEGNLIDIDPSNDPFIAVCSGNLFDPVSVMADDYLTVVSGDTANAGTANGLLFVKTGRTDLDPEVTNPKPDADDIAPAIRSTVVKRFVGGDVFANLDTTGGTNEPLQRQLLYSNCNIAGDPAKIKGEWRGVEIEETKAGFRDGSPVDLIPTNAADTVDNLVVTTTKVCVRLDSLPGTVKCFIDVVSTDPMVKSSRTISLYEDGEAMKIMDLRDNPVNDATTPGTLPVSGITQTAGFLFGGGADGTTADLPVEDVGQLCNLFGEGTAQ